MFSGTMCSFWFLIGFGIGYFFCNYEIVDDDDEEDEDEIPEEK